MSIGQRMDAGIEAMRNGARRGLEAANSHRREFIATTLAVVALGGFAIASVANGDPDNSNRKGDEHGLSADSWMNPSNWAEKLKALNSDIEQANGEDDSILSRLTHDGSGPTIAIGELTNSSEGMCDDGFLPIAKGGLKEGEINSPDEAAAYSIAVTQPNEAGQTNVATEFAISAAISEPATSAKYTKNTYSITGAYEKDMQKHFNKPDVTAITAMNQLVLGSTEQFGYIGPGAKLTSLEPVIVNGKMVAARLEYYTNNTGEAIPTVVWKTGLKNSVTIPSTKMELRLRDFGTVYAPGDCHMFLEGHIKEPDTAGSKSGRHSGPNNGQAHGNPRSDGGGGSQPGASPERNNGSGTGTAQGPNNGNHGSQNGSQNSPSGGGGGGGTTPTPGGGTTPNPGGGGGTTPNPGGGETGKPPVDQSNGGTGPSDAMQ